jgi:hypothetical protein
MTRVKRIFLVLFSLVLALLPAPADATWSRARSMDEPGWSASDRVSIAVSRNGGALMAWHAFPPNSEEPHELRVRRIDASGQLGPLRTLYRDATGGWPSDFSVAIDDDGDALVAWVASEYRGPEQVWARRLSRDGVAGPLLRLSDPDVNSTLPLAALTPRGRGAVSFQAGSGRVMYPLSRDNRVGKPTYPPQSALRLVATRDGDFVTAGSSSNGSQVVAVRLLPNGELMSRTISADPRMLNNEIVDIGVNRRGTATITFAGNNGQPGGQLWTRTWARDGTLGTARRIAPRAHRVVRATSRTDLEGDTVIVWSHAVESYRLVLYARILRRNGSLGPVHRLGPIEAADVFHPRPSPVPGLAIDDDGHGVVAWPSEPEAGHYITWVRRIRPDGTVGSKVMLQDMARPSAVGITPTGRARVGITTTPGWLLLKTGP